jgi:hypothetical protein
VYSYNSIWDAYGFHVSYADEFKLKFYELIIDIKQKKVLITLGKFEDKMARETFTIDSAKFMCRSKASKYPGVHADLTHTISGLSTILPIIQSGKRQLNFKETGHCIRNLDCSDCKPLQGPNNRLPLEKFGTIVNDPTKELWASPKGDSFIGMLSNTADITKGYQIFFGKIDHSSTDTSKILTDLENIQYSKDSVAIPWWPQVPWLSGQWGMEIGNLTVILNKEEVINDIVCRFNGILKHLTDNMWYYFNNATIDKKGYVRLNQLWDEYHGVGDNNGLFSQNYHQHGEFQT